MRNIILLLVFIPSILFSQSDSTRLDFYPLQIGNEWTYQSYCWEYSPTGIDTISIDTVTCSVFGDTIMPNKKKYYYISGVPGGFRRIDSLSQKVYEYDLADIISEDEYVLFDLSIVDSLFWIDGLGNSVEIRSTTEEQQVGYLNEKAIQTIYSGRYFFYYQVLSQGFGLSCLHFTCIPPEEVYILIKARINGIEYQPITTIDRIEWIAKPEFELFQNYPNPFNSSTAIKYSLPQEKSSYHVALKIYDIRGRLVNTLINQSQTAGIYSLNWDGNDMNGQLVSTGMYYYTLQADKYKETNKMLLIH